MSRHRECFLYISLLYKVQMRDFAMSLSYTWQWYVGMAITVRIPIVFELTNVYVKFLPYLHYPSSQFSTCLDIANFSYSPSLLLASMQCLNQDGVEIQLAISYQYRVRPSELHEIVMQFKDHDGFKQVLSSIGTCSI